MGIRVYHAASTYIQQDFNFTHTRLGRAWSVMQRCERYSCKELSPALYMKFRYHFSLWRQNAYWSSPVHRERVPAATSLYWVQHALLG